MVPIFRDVDVLVVGASSAAVGTALDLGRRGRRVMAVGDLAYFGEETAGALACAPDSPCAVKRRLETALLDAGIPFLFLVRPVALLRDGDGRLAGAVLAARTSLFAVTCRAVVDATRHGAVLALSSAARTACPAPATMGWNVVAAAPPPGGEELPVPFLRGGTPARVYRLRPPRGADPLSREHHARASLPGGEILCTADILDDVPDAEYAPAGDIFRPVDLAGIDDSCARRPGRIPPRSGPYRFAPAFLRESVGDIDWSPAEFPSLGRFDVAVAGGGTGGAPAGIAAAREGAETVVIEMQHGLGGVGTVGLITGYWFGNRTGFTVELDEAVVRRDAGYRGERSGHWISDLKSTVYLSMLRDAGGAAWLGSYVFGVRTTGDRVDGLLVSTPFGPGLVEAGCVVDATGNADVAAAAGAPCRALGAAHVAVQGAGMSPRSEPGTRCSNSDHTFVDDDDPEGVTFALANARAKFPDAFDTSPLADTRERRQIRGDIEVSPLDILAGRTFPDTVVVATSDFDTHGFIVHPLFMAAVPDHRPLRANVPFRCMLPAGLDGVLAVGLGMSAHRDAIPVIRMQADVQNQGFAAGLAAAAAAGGTPLRAIDVRALQRRLAAAGNIPAEAAGWEDSFPPGPEAVRAAAAGDLGAAPNAALLLAYPETSRPLLGAALGDSSAERRTAAALLLGLMGFPEAGQVLAEAVRGRAWDEGWNYRGMGQGGASMSRLDALIVALARTGEPSAGPVVAEKIRALDGTAAFSHCRVAAVAAALLPGLAGPLARLLREPGMAGHAVVDAAASVRAANGEVNETDARNRSLRELHLARGLFLAGDEDGLGRRTLETYARDLRGPYARHARAVLAAGPRPATDPLSLA